MAMKSIFVVDNGGCMSKSRMNNSSETKFEESFFREFFRVHFCQYIELFQIV